MNSFKIIDSMENSSSTSKIHKKNHKTGTPQTQDKTILYTSDYNEVEDKKSALSICTQHFLQYTHICLNCQNQCLCKSCLAFGKHSSHEVKTIKKGYVWLQSNLNQYLIRIRTKCDLLSLLCEIKKNDQIQQYERLEKQKHQIAKSFENIINDLRIKQIEIVKDIENYYERHFESNKKIMTSIRVNIQKSMDLYKELEKTINQSSPVQICRYYQLSLMKIKDFSTETVVQQYKKNFTNVECKFNYVLIRQLAETISNIKIEIPNSEKEKDKYSKKKLRKISKAPFVQRNNKCRLSHPALINLSVTGNSKQRKRQIKNIKIIEQEYTLRQNHQKGNEKMSSMPVSPKKQRHESSPIINMEIDKKNKTKIKH